MLAVFPGSFDPPTLGHIHTIERLSQKVDSLYVVAANNIDKNQSLFSAAQRVAMLTLCCTKFRNVTVMSQSGLLADFIAQHNIDVLVRSMRSQDDFQYEYSMQAMYREMLDIDTLFILSAPQYAHINATMVRQLIRLGSTDVYSFLPKEIHHYLDSNYGA